MSIMSDQEQASSECEEYNQKWYRQLVHNVKQSGYEDVKLKLPVGSQDQRESAEDKIEDDIEILPNIGNLRSQFEVKEKTPPPPEEKKPAKLRQTWTSSKPEPEEIDSERTRVNGTQDDEEIAREKRGREEIHFEQLDNIRTRFENIAAGQKDTTHSPEHSPRSVSVWERKESESSDNEGSEGPGDLPPPEQTKGLLARFRQMETEAEQEVIPERKPVRKFTPPRQGIELQSSAAEHDQTPERDPNVIRHDDPNPEEEQMPQTASTKNLLAKFKSWEKTNEEQSSPALSVVREKTAFNKPKYSAHSKAVVFENVGKEQEPAKKADVRPLVQAAEHGVFENIPNERPDVMRETDDQEADLPQLGATKSLLAQWKSIESADEVNKEATPTPN